VEKSATSMALPYWYPWDSDTTYCRKGNGAALTQAVVKIAAAVFVCSPMPRRQMAKVMEKIPAPKKKTRIPIVMVT
jgi:hypothetical protein